MDDDVVSRLRAVGMTLYEAKVYVGLLKSGPQNGNEVAKSAGLPSSKVYSTLEKLASLGIVHSMKRGTSTTYVCISPDELVKRLRSRFSEPLDYLQRTLPSLGAFVPSTEVLTVSGLDAIRENGRYIVNHARRQVYLSIWADDLDSLRDALIDADARGVRIFAMIYGDEATLAVGSALHHSYGGIVADRLKGRMLTLGADQEEALIAHIPRNGDATGVRTRNPVLALVTQEYLHHDIVLQRAQLRVGFAEWDEWWQADPDLRTLILGDALRDTEGLPAHRDTKEG
jgi:sugar-specific transcriptional regulator TrmB